MQRDGFDGLAFAVLVVVLWFCALASAAARMEYCNVMYWHLLFLLCSCGPVCVLVGLPEWRIVT